MIPENCALSQVDGWTGQQLHRPECVLAHRSGLLIVPNWFGNGGISLIDTGGNTHAIHSHFERPLRPNGIALEPGGSVLLAHLGDTEGGIYRLFPDGSVDAVITLVDGEPMPPANFVVLDSSDRIWLTVSTRKTPRAADYRAGANSGFIAVAEPGSNEARIVADHLGYTNECVIDEQRGYVWVNETFARRLTRYSLSSGRSRGDTVILSNPHCVKTFNAGTYPDGLALDDQGYLWVTSIVSNRILRISPHGQTQLMFEDSDAAHLAWTENAYRTDSLGREHLDKACAQAMKNISNMAFGGSARQRIYLGNLLGDSLPYIDSEFTGAAMLHWDVPLGDLQTLIDKST